MHMWEVFCVSYLSPTRIHMLLHLHAAVHMYAHMQYCYGMRTYIRAYLQAKNAACIWHQ